MLQFVRCCGACTEGVLDTARSFPSPKYDGVHFASEAGVTITHINFIMDLNSFTHPAALAQPLQHNLYLSEK